MSVNTDVLIIGGGMIGSACARELTLAGRKVTVVEPEGRNGQAWQAAAGLLAPQVEAAESDAMLEYLFLHQAQEKYLYSHAWTPGDLLMWDNIGTVHNAVADYRADEPRYMRRLQVMATKDYARLAA